MATEQHNCVGFQSRMEVRGMKHPAPSGLRGDYGVWRHHIGTPRNELYVVISWPGPSGVGPDI